MKSLLREYALRCWIKALSTHPSILYIISTTPAFEINLNCIYLHGAGVGQYVHSQMDRNIQPHFSFCGCFAQILK